MSEAEIETRFNAALSRVVAVLEQEDPGQVLDGAGAMQLLAEVKPRTAMAIASDLEGWLSWWQEKGRQAGGTLHQSIPAYVEHLVDSGLSPNTFIRYRYSIKRTLAALGRPVEDNASIPSIELLTCHTTIEKMRWAGPKATPFGWDKIRNCVRTADPDNRREVNALAGMLVLYEAMAWSDQIFGHCHGGIWHALPARRDDLRRMPDGDGRLRLASMKRGDAARYVTLSPLAMEWIERTHSFVGSHGGPLLVGSRGGVLPRCTWERWVRALISRAGMDARKFSCASLRLGMVKDLCAAGFTIDEVLAEGGWTTPFPIVRLLHGKSRSRETHRARVRHEWIRSRGAHQARSAAGSRAVAQQMSFPGM